MKQLFFLMSMVMLIMGVNGCGQEKTACDFCGVYRFENFSKSEQTFNEENQIGSRRSLVVHESFGEDYYSYWNDINESGVNQLVKDIYFKDQKLELNSDGTWAFYVKVLESFGGFDEQKYSVERTVNENGRWTYLNSDQNYINLSRHSTTVESEIYADDYTQIDVPIADFPFYKRWTYQDDQRPFEIVLDEELQLLTLASLGEDETIQNRSIYSPSYSICEGNVFTTMSPYEGKKLTFNK